MDRILVFIIGLALCLVILKYRVPIKDFIGDIGFAEKYLGAGGTHTLIVLVALATFIFSLFYAVGTLQSFLYSFFGRFFGA